MATFLGGLPLVCVAELSYFASASLEYDDNITRVPRNPQSEWINALTVGLNYQEITTSANQRIAANVRHRNYLTGNYPNDLALELDAFGEWFIRPRTLSWVATDVAGLVLTNPTVPNTPDNQQKSNVFATGPNVYLNLSPVDTLVLESRYGSVWVENLGLDNTRSQFASRWLHRLSERNTLSLHYQYLDVDFLKDLRNSDNYIRQDGFIRGAIHFNISQFQIDLGKTRIERQTGEPLSGSLVRFNWTARLSSLTSLSFLASQEYSDSAIELTPSGANTQPPTPAPGEPSSPGAYQGYLTSQPFYVDRAEFNLNSAALGVPFSVRLYSNDISYANPALDSEERGIAGGAQLPLSATVDLVGSVRRSVINFTSTAIENIDNEFRLGSTYRMGPRLSTGLSWIYTNRISSVSTGDYTDNRIVFTVTYGTGLSSPASAPSLTY